VDGYESLEDIARFVGHARPATTAGYVKRLGRRPEAVAKRAAAILDGQAAEDSPEVRNHPGANESDRGSDAPEPPGGTDGPV
jgi:hypothetical protein